MTDEALLTWMTNVQDLLIEIRDSLKKPERKKPIPKDSTLPKLIELWNSLGDPSFRKVASASPSGQRWKSAEARWAEKPDEEYWRMVLLRLNRSSFARGKNGKKWVADFEFFSRPDRHAQILEGKYDDDRTRKDGSTGKTIQGYLPDGTPVYG